MSGLTYDDYLEHTGQSEDDIKAELEPTATQRVKRVLVLNAIAEAEGIAVSDDELQAEVKKLIEESPMPSYTEQILQDSDRLEGLRESLLRERATDLLVQEAVVTEKEIESQGHGHHHHHHDEDDADHAEDEDGDSENNPPVDDDENAGETG